MLRVKKIAPDLSRKVILRTPLREWAQSRMTKSDGGIISWLKSEREGFNFMHTLRT